MERQGTIGSSFDSFLEEQGILQVCEEDAIQQIRTDQMETSTEVAIGDTAPAQATNERHNGVNGNRPHDRS